MNVAGVTSFSILKRVGFEKNLHETCMKLLLNCGLASWFRDRASDYENPGSHPLLPRETSSTFFTLHYSSSFSCIDEYLAIDSDVYLYKQSSCINCRCGWILLYLKTHNWNYLKTVTIFAGSIYQVTLTRMVLDSLYWKMNNPRKLILPMCNTTVDEET